MSFFLPKKRGFRGNGTMNTVSVCTNLISTRAYFKVMERSRLKKNDEEIRIHTANRSCGRMRNKLKFAQPTQDRFGVLDEDARFILNS
jgi:hypothetical protein